MYERPGIQQLMERFKLNICANCFATPVVFRERRQESEYQSMQYLYSAVQHLVSVRTYLVHRRIHREIGLDRCIEQIVPIAPFAVHRGDTHLIRHRRNE